MVVFIVGAAGGLFNGNAAGTRLGRGRVAGASFQPPTSRFGVGDGPLGARGARLIGGGGPLGAGGAGPVVEVDEGEAVESRD